MSSIFRRSPRTSRCRGCIPSPASAWPGRSHRISLSIQASGNGIRGPGGSWDGRPRRATCTRRAATGYPSRHRARSIPASSAACRRSSPRWAGGTPCRRDAEPGHVGDPQLVGPVGMEVVLAPLVAQQVLGRLRVNGNLEATSRRCGGNLGPNTSYAASPRFLRYCIGLT